MMRIIYLLIKLTIIVMDEQKKKKISATITAIVTLITTLVSIWLLGSCTLSLSLIKDSENSHQQTDQSIPVSVDSASINFPKPY